MASAEEHDQIESAIHAYRANQLALAREIIASVLSKYPWNADAWGWACEFAATNTEKITCLKHILSIDPENSAARRYLETLTGFVGNRSAMPPTPARINSAPINRQSASITLPAAPGPPSIDKNKKNLRAIDYLLIPFGILLNIPLLFYVAILLAGLAVYGYLYYETNTIAISGPDFDHMTISSSFQEIDSTNGYWKISWEKPMDSTFSGLVRHVNVDRVDNFSILSHDILVTSGDFAKPDLVRTFVSDHHFSWQSNSAGTPAGTINLLHIVPGSKAIFNDLVKVKEGDQVSIGGREILKIDYFDQHGVYKGYWEDSGCNSIVVTSVNIQNPPPQGQ